MTGAYDCIPLMDAFLEEHPDASYHGAKGTVALTGYNGILGYRTDIAYKTRQNLAEDQEAYLAANPDFDWDAEVAEAKKVAEAIKEDGWILPVIPGDISGSGTLVWKISKRIRKNG